MRLTGIAASPRRGGNSEALLDSALAGAREAGAEVEKIAAAELDIEPCRNCGGCSRTGTCVVGDDMRRLYALLRRTDRLVISSPIFFGHLPGKFKGLIDRLQCFWVEKYALKKEAGAAPPRREGKGEGKGLFLCCGALKTREFFEMAKRTIEIAMKCLDMELGEALFFPGIDEKLAADAHPEILDEARAAGRRLAER